MRWRKQKERNSDMQHVTYLSRPPTLHYPHQSCYVGWGPGYNQLCQVASKSVQWFWLPEGSNLPFPMFSVRAQPKPFFQFRPKPKMYLRRGAAPKTKLKPKLSIQIRPKPKLPTTLLRSIRKCLKRLIWTRPDYYVLCNVKMLRCTHSKECSKIAYVQIVQLESWKWCNQRKWLRTVQGRQ